MAGMLVAASFCGGALASLLLGVPAGAQGPAAVTTGQVNLVDAGGGLRGVLSAQDESGSDVAGVLRRGRPDAYAAGHRAGRGFRRSICGTRRASRVWRPA